MDLNVTVATNELFDNNDMIFPIFRENLKVSLASPGSESSGVSSLDAEEAKKLANDQLTTSSSSPELASEPNSSEQTEDEELSDESNENEQSSDEEQSSSSKTPQKSDVNGKLNVTTATTTTDFEQEQRSPESANITDVNETNTTTITTKIETNETANDKNEKTISENQNEQDTSLDTFETTKSIEEFNNNNNNNNVTPAAQNIRSLTEEVDTFDGIRYNNLKLIYGGRDILDLANNLNKSCNIQYTHLPDFYIPMYMANRSQYHRLGASWETHELKYAFCRRCGFRYVPDEPSMIGGQTTKSGCNSDPANLLCNLSHIAAVTAPIGNQANNNNNLMQNMTLSAALNRISPTNSTLNPATPKFQPSSTTPLPTSSVSGQMFNINNMMNNNNTNNNQQQQQSYGYQNQMSAQNNNNMSAYKQQQQQQQHQHQQHHQQQQNAPANAFYGNMTLNSMISQLAMDTNNSTTTTTTPTTFNPNQYLNGGANGTNYTPNINQMANHNNLNTSAIINQLINQNRQSQGGMCRPLANKSGINLNANSHNKMPAYKMYSHF